MAQYESLVRQRERLDAIVDEQKRELVRLQARLELEDSDEYKISEKPRPLTSNGERVSTTVVSATTEEVAEDAKSDSRASEVAEPASIEAM